MSPMNNRLLRPRSGVGATDADARAYVQAVQTADGQALEAAVVKAIDNFVIGCKADGIWTALKASCILMGARTLNGILTPLVGTAPTSNAFVGDATDYNRKTGLTGNGTTKYIDTGRAGNADGQNDMHAAVYVSSWSTAQAGYRAFIGSGDNQNGATNLFWTDGLASSGTRSRSSIADVLPGTAISGNLAKGLYGLSRSASSGYTLRANQSNLAFTRTSQTPTAFNWWVFTTNNNGSVVNATPSTLMFYSVGTSLTLSTLESRLSTLEAAIAAAIP